MLKSGQLPCLVATSSLELGIDMGAVDLVIQVESPKSVSRGLQRVGRAGHSLGEVSKGRIFPKFRGDLLECAVVARRMREGEIEETVIPQNPLDVLAQHLVSMAALDEWDVDEMERLVTATEPFRELSREQLENVLDMLDGRYPSDRFAELRPGIGWDRTGGTVHGRKGARQLVVTNAGTIPDRGLYGVHLPDGRRVGELDEEMVYEARPGQTFLLGATTWRIEEITRDRVIVTPAPGLPGAVPFGKGNGTGRPAELGRAIGAFPREAVSRDPEELAGEYALDRRAAENLVAYLREQQAATRVVPSDETIVVERFRDEIGDWRLCLLSPFGGRVHSAWGLALGQKIREELELEADAIWSDDGIVIHLPDADEPPPADLIMVEPDELEDRAERRAAALSLDRDLLRELLGQEELRELIDPEALEEVEAQLQHRTEAGRAADRDALQQLLRNIGDLTAEECAERVSEGYSSASMLEKLVAERRVALVRIGGEERYIAGEGAALPRRVGGADGRPRGLAAHPPAGRDALCAGGEWVGGGAGARGRSAGRVPLSSRGAVRLAGPPPANAKLERAEGAAQDAIRERLLAGPSFWLDLLADLDFPAEELHNALWDLTWNGEVTNDAFAPLRAPRLRSAPAHERRGRRFARRRSSAGAAVQGRWSLTAPLFADAPGPGAKLRAQAELMLERYGIVTRETVLAEGVPGGFATLYAELGNLELLGTARRGYFVEGLGGAQFALPGAVERLRSLPEAEAGFQVLAATDPANAYAAALPWPKPPSGRRPARAPGAYVLLRDGEPLVYVERDGRSILRLGELGDPHPAAPIQALAEAVSAGRLPKLGIEKLDREPVIGSGPEEALLRPRL